MNVTRELGSNTYLVTHTVGPYQHGIRLDAFLKDRYRRRSREVLKKAISSGAIIVERTQGPHLTIGALKPSTQLIPGDQVLVRSDKKPEPEVDFNYRTLFEDKDILILDKPANLPVHPAGRFFFNTLLTHLQTKGFTEPMSEARQFYLVHRIDRETSGVLALAKNTTVTANLVRQFARRETGKTYMAIVRGTPPAELEITTSMRRSLVSRIGLKMESCAPDAERAQAARTTIKVLKSAGGFSLVECTPKTGRQHQIRVHLDSIGHPIVGDKLYGMDESEALRFYDRTQLTAEAEARLLMPRHALHAASLTVTHPVTGQLQTFHSPLPADMELFLRKLD